jgi:DNA-binding NarL/FixJ family response regulator
MLDGSKAPGVKFPKTILFAEGAKGHRHSVSATLLTSGYNVIAATSGADAIQTALEFQGPIHLLLASVQMPDMTGIELAERIKRERPDTRFFITSELDSGVLVLDHGWHFLPSPFAADLLKTRIRDILKEPPLAAKGFPPPENARVEQDPLTSRERQVLNLIAAGNSTKQVAAALGIAFKTAVGHRSRLMKKLNIHDSATLVRYAIRVGIIDP